MGFNSQATVAQYLNGHMALNTDAILAFSRYLDVAPWDIDPRLEAAMAHVAAPIQVAQVPIVATLSGSPVKRNPDGSCRTVPVIMPALPPCARH